MGDLSPTSRTSRRAAKPDRKQKEKFDLTKLWGWDPERVWLCDIEEGPREPDNDFLFMAKITDDGAADEIRDNETSDRCIFQDIMYDIQKFIPDKSPDGRLDFSIKFGDNTVERAHDAPYGWTVTFKGLTPAGPKRYVGTINTSWWGDRPVQLMNYTTLTEEELSRYPDLMTNRYWKSMPRVARPVPLFHLHPQTRQP